MLEITYDEKQNLHTCRYMYVDSRVHMLTKIFSFHDLLEGRDARECHPTSRFDFSSLALALSIPGLSSFLSFASVSVPGAASKKLAE